MTQGGTLRILDANRFSVVWTPANWATTHHLDAHGVGRPGYFADIATTAEQSGSILFTLYWPEQNRWLGRNYEVEIHAELPQQEVAAVKPRS